MDSLDLTKLKKLILAEKAKPRVLLFDPRDDFIDQAFIDLLSELDPKPIVIDFQQYDLNQRESLYYVYLDINYYASEIAQELVDENLEEFVKLHFEKGLDWVKAGSHVPISNFLRNFLEEYKTLHDKFPWIVLANIDVETEVNHATIGTIVFDVVTSPYSEKTLITCTSDSWKEFDKGRDIFARISSRLRSSVSKLVRDDSI